jgi:hypothetical protein
MDTETPAETNIKILERFQFKVLRLISGCLLVRVKFRHL